MGRIDNLQGKASTVAQESTCQMRHGSMVVCGNRVKAVGHNTTARTYVFGEHHACLHAELHSAMKFVNIYIRRYPRHKRARKIRAATVWSVRLLSTGLGYAKPCHNCLNVLRKLGFGRVAYSNMVGEIEVHPLCKIENKHLSHSQKSFFYNSKKGKK